MSDKHESRARAFVVAHVERELAISSVKTAEKAEKRCRLRAAQRERELEGKHGLPSGFLSGTIAFVHKDLVGGGA